MGFLWGIAIFGALAAIARTIEARYGAKAGASKLEDTMRTMFEPDPHYVPTHAKEYAHLDLAFYDAAAQEAASRGFRLLGDVDPKHVAQQEHMHPTFLRVLTDDASTTIAVYNLRMRGWLRWLAWPMRNLRTCDVESELSDGTFIVTNNAWNARHFEQTSAIESFYMPNDTALAALLERHAERLAERLRSTPELRAVAITTLEQMTASQVRMHHIKLDPMRKRGFQLTREELRGFASDSETKVRRDAADDLADVYEGLPPREPKPQPLSTMIFKVALWLVLVVGFIVGYRLLQISQR